MFKVIFFGRKRGAIGIFFRHEEIIFVTSDSEVENKIREKYEVEYFISIERK